MKRERCGARCRDGHPCGAPAIRGRIVCRRHGGGAPQVKAIADRTAGIEQARASLPFLEAWTWRLVDEHKRAMITWAR